MARRFVLVEILDREVRYLLEELRSVFNGRRSNTPVHVTIRGPYPTPVGEELIESLTERLRKDVLLIAGVGMFKSPTRAVVFLRVKSKRLRGVWWKPDFPTKTHGFQPHISLYEGPRLDLAEAIYQFLKVERIELVSHEFQVVSYASGQFPSFYESPNVSRGSASQLVASGCIKEGILARARRLMKQHERQLALFSDSTDVDADHEGFQEREPLMVAAASSKH